MLYVSTRSRADSYTAYRTLHEMRAPDGGMYVPFRLPEFSHAEILQMKKSTFGDTVAQLLNLFFSARLTGRDVEFCCGRYPIKIASQAHRLLFTQLWHNVASNYNYIERALYTRLAGTAQTELITDWAKIAIRIAVYFGIYAHCSSEFETKFDIAVENDDFVAPIAAWYARKMGLPIGTIICGCCDNSTVWDLLHRGQMSTINWQACQGVERLIHATLGYDEVVRLVDAIQKQRTYDLPPELTAILGSGTYIAVVSSSRIPSVISNFYRSHVYKLDHSAAISFSALQDFRSQTGESNQTMIISLLNPDNETCAI